MKRVKSGGMRPEREKSKGPAGETVMLQSEDWTVRGRWGREYLEVLSPLLWRLERVWRAWLQEVAVREMP